MAETTTDVDLMDSRTYVPGVPHEYFAHLRATAPVQFRAEGNPPGYWAVTSYDECVTVNRDWEHFSSYQR